MSTSNRTARFLVLFAAYFGLLFLLIIIQGILDAAGILSFRTTLLPFLLLHLILPVIFFILILRVNNPRRDLRWLQEHGRPTTARILEIEPTGWRIRRRDTIVLSRRPSSPGREYRLRLEVMPAGAPPYEVTTHQYLSLNAIPEVGSLVPIKIHPQHPNQLILDEPLSS